MVSLEDLKEFGVRYEAAKGNPEELAKLQREVFDFVDKDKSGFIERNEIERMFRGMVKMVLKQMGMNPDALPEEAKAEMEKQVEEKSAAIMAVLDIDSDGKVTFEEFQKGAAKMEELNLQ